MATTRLLLKEICAAVREALAGYPFPAPDGSWGDVRVFLHGLPQEQGDACYPFVIVRWISGSMEEETAQVTRLRETVGLALGVYASKTQEQAGILLAELLDCLRRSLWKGRILAGRFELEEPVKAEIPTPRTRWNEYHLATIETVWNYVWPSRGLEELTKMERP
nr:MAG TPA: tail completion protein [Caudoviricetes sp.]